MFRWLTEKLKQRKAQRLQAVQAANEAFSQRMRNPDFDLVRRHFGRSISESLRKLYSDQAELDRQCVSKKVGPREDDALFVAWYVPLDEQAYSEQWHHDDGRLDFADDGSASRLTVDPTDDGAEIFYFQHEDQTFHPTGVKMRNFLSLPELEP
jgi:hypothetical protein